MGSGARAAHAFSSLRSPRRVGPARECALFTDLAPRLRWHDACYPQPQRGSDDGLLVEGKGAFPVLGRRPFSLSTFRRRCQEARCEQDRADQVRAGRPRHRRIDPALRRAGLRGYRGGRRRATEVVGAVRAQAHARPLHDAHPHPERPDHRGPAAHARHARQPVRPRRRRHHHPPAAAAALADDRRHPDGARAPPRGGPGDAADRDGQHPQRGRLRGGGAHPQRAVRRLAGRACVHRGLRRRPSLHEPAAQVQRDDHRVPGQLHARRDAGPRPGAGHPRRRRRDGRRLQRPGRRQERLGRLPDRDSPRPVRATGRGGRRVLRRRPALPRSRPP